jgi:hypothetical protein
MISLNINRLLNILLLLVEQMDRHTYLRMFFPVVAVTGVATINRSTRNLAVIFVLSVPFCCTRGDLYSCLSQFCVTIPVAFQHLGLLQL